eukprot:m.1056115 g.1056115  ORF g.1056115 m.1056115 type:complete len:645 (-) comp24197_c0_seq4:1581-3515(-)
MSMLSVERDDHPIGKRMNAKWEDMVIGTLVIGGIILVFLWYMEIPRSTAQISLRYTETTSSQQGNLRSEFIDPTRIPDPSPIRITERHRQDVRVLPNIVFILADDLGWRDVGYNGGGNGAYVTPHVDALAAEGVVFTASYQHPNCAPSRASIVTGLYPPRHHLYTPGGVSTGQREHMRVITPTSASQQHRNSTTGDRLRVDTDAFESHDNWISPSLVSFAEAVPAAYVTARFGKWQLGSDNQGFMYNSGSGSIPEKFAHHKNFYGDVDVANRLTATSINFIYGFQDTPFLLFLAHWDVHMPTRCLPERREFYVDRLTALVHRTCNATHSETHATPAACTPSNRSLAWQVSAEYGGQIMAFDDSVGNVVRALERLHLRNRTLVVVSSDNGGSAQRTSSAPLQMGKGSLREGGIRVPTVFSWPGVLAQGHRIHIPISGVDYFPTFIDFASHGMHNKQPAAPNTAVDGISLSTLLTGTLTARPQEHVDATSQTATHPLTQRALFWHFPHYLVGQECAVSVPLFGTSTRLWRAVPSSAIRLGWYKLILNFESNTSALFDLEHDPGETTDLAHTPRFAAAKTDLEARLWTWLATTQAPIPWQLNHQFRNCTSSGDGPVAMDGKDQLVDDSGAPCAVHVSECHPLERHAV